MALLRESALVLPSMVGHAESVVRPVGSIFSPSCSSMTLSFVDKSFLPVPSVLTKTSRPGPVCEDVILEGFRGTVRLPCLIDCLGGTFSFK